MGEIFVLYLDTENQETLEEALNGVLKQLHTEHGGWFRLVTVNQLGRNDFLRNEQMVHQINWRTVWQAGSDAAGEV